MINKMSKILFSITLLAICVGCVSINNNENNEQSCKKKKEIVFSIVDRERWILNDMFYGHPSVILYNDRTLISYDYKKRVYNIAELEKEPFNKLFKNLKKVEETGFFAKNYALSPGLSTPDCVIYYKINNKELTTRIAGADSYSSFVKDTNSPVALKYVFRCVDVLLNLNIKTLYRPKEFEVILEPYPHSKANFINDNWPDELNKYLKDGRKLENGSFSFRLPVHKGNLLVPVLKDQGKPLSAIQVMEKKWWISYIYRFEGDIELAQAILSNVKDKSKKWEYVDIYNNNTNEKDNKRKHVD